MNAHLCTAAPSFACATTGPFRLERASSDRIARSESATDPQHRSRSPQH